MFGKSKHKPRPEELRPNTQDYVRSAMAKLKNDKKFEN